MPSLGICDSSLVVGCSALRLSGVRNCSRILHTTLDPMLCAVCVCVYKEEMFLEMLTGALPSIQHFFTGTFYLCGTKLHSEQQL